MTGSIHDKQGVIQHERSFSGEPSFTNRGTSERRYPTENTVQCYVQKILRRLDSVVIAIRNGWIQ